MRKLDKSKKREYPPLNLYRRDLEAIVGIFTSRELHIHIRAGGYELETIDELDGLEGETLPDFRVKCDTPDISVRFGSGEASVSVEDAEDTFAAGIVSKLDEVILVRKSRRRWFKNPLLAGTGWALLLGATLTLSVAIAPPISPPVAAVGSAMGVIGGLIAWQNFRLDGDGYCLIYRVRRTPEGNFWRRNRDEVALSVVFLVVGYVVGKLLP